MLAACIHMMRGTPYIFQGEELGITNAGYTDISQYRDIESLNYYRIMLESGKTKEEALETLRQRSRDNGRTPMQWDDRPNAGFTDGTPWIQLPENYRTINVEAELQDQDSILHFYKALIRLRKENPLISDGKIEFLYPDETRLLAYRRFLGNDSLWVFNNLSGKELSLPFVRWSDGCERLLGNYLEVSAPGGQLLLRPYETIACRLTDWG